MPTKHPNSITANENGKAGPFGKRAQAIIDVYKQCSSITDREVKKALGFEDMNAVRPRITELVKAGVLMECGSIADPVTGMRVRLVRLAQKQGKLF